MVLKELEKDIQKNPNYKEDDNGVLYDKYGFDSTGLNKDGYDIDGFDKDGFNKDGSNKYGHKKKSTKKNTKSKIKASRAKSFRDQKGKGYINLPILLSKAYTNNNSKELINNIKQIINNLYDNKQITSQVYNNLIEAVTYKNDS